MRLPLILFILMLFSTRGSAQIEKLVGNGISGVVMAPVFKFSFIEDDFSFFMGVKTGIVINNIIAIGGGLHVLTNRIRANVPERDLIIDMDYGGFMIEYIFNSMEPLRFSAGFLIGGGRVAYRKRANFLDKFESEPFFIVEPEVNMMVNISRSIWFSVGQSFRIMNGVDLQGISDADLNKLSLNLAFIFEGKTGNNPEKTD